MVDDPRTELRLFRVIPDGCNQMLWHKCATSAECKPIRIAVSTVTDGWKGHTVPLSDVFLKKVDDLNVDLTLITTKLWE